MSNDDRTAALRDELDAHRRTLAEQLRQRVLLGPGREAALLERDLAETRASIARVKAELAVLGVDQPALSEDDPAPAIQQIITGGSYNVQAIDSTVSVTHNHYPDPPPLDPVDPELARQALASLPLDQVPEPAKIRQPGSRMTYDPNPLFTGREAELLALAAALKAGDANVISTGIGGVGKTTLAIEAAWRYGPHFLGGVFWVSCAKAENIPGEIAACGGLGALQLQGFAGRPQTEQVQAVLAEWARDIPRLLIYDNCEDPELLREYRPKGGSSRVLVTSRNAVWPPTLGAATLALDVLSLDESTALLRRLCERLTDAEAAQVAEALGRLPLALHLAGSYLERYGTLVKDYLIALASPTLLDHPSLTGRGVKDRPTGRDLPVARAFALSFDQLDQADPIDAAALALLARAACLAPGEPFPQSLLEDALPVAEGDEAAVLDRADGLARLLELGLLERAGDGALRLHRLICAFARATVRDEVAQAAVEDALTNLGSALVNTRMPAQLTPILPHIRMAVDVAFSRADEYAAGLCYVLGRLLHSRGELASARRYYERALAIREQVLGALHLDTATSLSDLGGLLQDQGDLAGARLYYERALEIEVRLRGPDDLNTSIILNNLATLSEIEGDYRTAHAIYERAFEITQRVLGTYHPETATSLNNLAVLFKIQGQYDYARLFCEQALAIREQVLEPQHPDIATSLNNLASLDQSQGNFSEALPNYRRALAIREHSLGSFHPDTATSMNNLGLLLKDLGDYEEAQRLYERALVIREHVLGTNHLDIAQSLNNLGALYLRKGDRGKARPYLERAFAIREKVLGVEHSDTAQSLNNLAYLLVEQGDYTEARLMHERVLAIYEKALGPQHPTTAHSLNNLAYLHQQQGDVETAREFYDRALGILDARLGANHPTTREVQKNRESLDTPPFSQQIAEIIEQSEFAVALALADAAIDRIALAQQLEKRACWAEEGEAEGSPFVALAATLRALAARLGSDQ